MERRLAAILAADVVEYSRLMGEDEARMLAALSELRGTLFEPVVAGRGGRVIKRMGDGWLVEFNNAADAVAGAIEVQSSLHDHELIKLRIGVHVGDVTFQDNDIYGDGVNVAARLEALAEPGQILISDTAHHSLDGKAAVAFDGGNLTELKNISRKVAVWIWPASFESGKANEITSHIIASTFSEKPSIAVLPFDNMSGDSEQEYFSDGLTEDLITQLSYLRWLFVVARNSTFSYKGKAKNIVQIAQELGVRYILEGSVRKASNRIRINAQLIDGRDGNHLWAEKFDRELTDIFELQDELTKLIASNVDVEMAGSEEIQAVKKSSQDLNAWDLYQQGMWHFHNGGLPDGLDRAEVLYEAAIDVDQNFAGSYAALAYLHSARLLLGRANDTKATIDAIFASAHQAIKIDKREAVAYLALGRAHIMSGEQDRAVLHFEKALNINPNSCLSYYGLGLANFWAGNAELALPYYDAALSLSPNDPQRGIFIYMRANSGYLSGNYSAEHAIRELSLAEEDRTDDIWPPLSMAMMFVERGDIEQASAALSRGISLREDLTLAMLPSLLPGFPEEYMQRFRGALRIAGMPEK